MRLVAVAAVIVIAVSVRADDRRSVRPHVETIVPIDPQEHERLHFFGRRDHHVVPGTVTINAMPYACDLDGQHFRERDAFVAHLRTVHRAGVERIPDRLVVKDGIVHFIGE